MTKQDQRGWMTCEAHLQSWGHMWDATPASVLASTALCPPCLLFLLKSASFKAGPQPLTRYTAGTWSAVSGISTRDKNSFKVKRRYLNRGVQVAQRPIECSGKDTPGLLLLPPQVSLTFRVRRIRRGRPEGRMNFQTEQQEGREMGALHPALS